MKTFYFSSGARRGATAASEVPDVDDFVPPPPRPADGFRYMAEMAAALNAAIADGLIQHTGTTFDVYHGETILPLESPEIKEGQHEIWLGVAPTQEAIMLAGIGPWMIREEPVVASAATLVISAWAHLNSDGPRLPGNQSISPSAA